MIQKSPNRKAWLTPLLLVLLVFACQKNDEAMDTSQADSQTSLSPEVGAAKAWFEGSHSATRQSTSIGIGEAEKGAISYRLGALNARPKWSEAWVGKDEVVEVPLDLTAKTAYSTGPNATAAELDAQVTRLLVLNDKQGKPLAVLMHIVGDVAYLQKKRYSLTANRYKSMEADFTGSVLYTFLDGTFCNGWQYEGGKIAKRISAAPDEPQPIRASLYCVEFTYDFWTLGCVDAGTHLDCGDWRLTDSYEMVVCVDDGGGGGGSGSGGDTGGSGGGGGGGVELPDTPDSPDLSTPCEQLAAMKEDAMLSQKVKEYTADAAINATENGYLMTSNGYPQPPSRRGVTYVEFNYAGTYTEAVHLHPLMWGGAHIFSTGDLNELYRMYRGGHLADTASFRFVVVASYASGALHITNPAAFEAFAQKYGLGVDEIEELEEFNKEFERIVQPATVTSLDEAEANFMKLLEGSGLSFSVGFNVGDETLWHTKSLQNGAAITIGCP